MVKIRHCETGDLLQTIDTGNVKGDALATVAWLKSNGKMMVTSYKDTDDNVRVNVMELKEPTNKSTYRLQ